MSNVPTAGAPYPSDRFIGLARLTETEIIRRLTVWASRPGEPVYLDFPALPQMLSSPPKMAAVLIPFVKINEEWELLFTRRNSTLPEHSGQVAFPGGRADPDDITPDATALREAYEEIGLKPTDVRILGKIGKYLTITNYLITPVVGVIPWPYPLHPAIDEVSRIFTIPLSWIANPANSEERLRELPGQFGAAGVIYFHPYDGETLWGASARITLNLIKILSAADR